MKLIIRTERLFKCTCCNTVFIADKDEYWQEEILMKPNCYSWCPECGGQVWESDISIFRNYDERNEDETRMFTV